ncbi:alpha/beta fold hydrolase [Chitinophaga pinensis]|uniref:Alpha/beta hydrolase fold protein n=1 Tax=Chitinophaga pinensis (strain ATCC 43595 / DSM 2588 / LMG 13176 / NBRC 15968 / NCIMB 11800 / UQM 2034) TaxID=485918 RepID=A0A979G722_CHIPD|nr:alpha/beta hydrolase [Chitinophaga pinensis]ACU61980.1 alpha/beta hydrolase fold protein [Chitinophaga pinensis DSM 2588]
MSTHTHVTAPTQYIQVKGNKLAYRRYGSGKGLPMVFMQHFTGTMDNWDPAVMDALAKDREVIIFNTTGISSSEGEPKNNTAAIASDAAAFIDALGLQQIDLLGFSMGSFAAQQLTLDRPELVRKLILVGSGPRGGEGLDTFSPLVWDILSRTYDPADELLLDTFFTPSEASQQAGRRFLDRIRARVENRDPAISDKVVPAQLAAITAWGTKHEGSYDYLKEIKVPVLIVSGHDDIIFPTVNNYILQQHLPDAQLIIYPDTNHGSIYQYPELFVIQVNLFLKGIA